MALCSQVKEEPFKWPTLWDSHEKGWDPPIIKQMELEAVGRILDQLFLQLPALVVALWEAEEGPPLWMATEIDAAGDWVCTMARRAPDPKGIPNSVRTSYIGLIQGYLMESLTQPWKAEYFPMTINIRCTQHTDKTVSHFYLHWICYLTRQNLLIFTGKLIKRFLQEIPWDFCGKICLHRNIWRFLKLSNVSEKRY